MMEVTRKRMSSRILAAASLRSRAAQFVWKGTVDGIKGLSKPFAQVVGTGIMSARVGPSSYQQTSVSVLQEISKSVPESMSVVGEKGCREDRLTESLSQQPPDPKS